MKLRTILLAAALSVAPGVVHAQFDFHLEGRDVQIHSFGSQGFAYSNNNNYLSMHTSDGSFSMTDGGINIGTQLTDNFHVAAQLYDRNVGHLGNWRPELDYAVGDYRFKDWFGVRGGKVKTTIGLLNDTQDLSFLYTWALLPQSVYPVDARGDNIAHIGGDLYGNIPVKHLGAMSYTLYGGQRPSDAQSGLFYGNNTSAGTIQPNGSSKYTLTSSRHMSDFSGPVFGADMRWTTPLKGLLAGASFMNLDVTGQGVYVATGSPYTNVTTIDKTYAYYTQYTVGNFNFSGEYRRQVRDTLNLTAVGLWNPSLRNTRQGYVAAAYRVSKRLEVGAYHSRFIGNWQLNHGDSQNHVFDTTLSSKFDLKSYLDLKVEGHFIDGNYVNSGMSRGFFVAENTQGFKPSMKLLVIKLEYHL